MSKVTVFWFRRDLRLEDNAGLYFALKERSAVLPVFIFDSEILGKLKDPADPRVTFIYDQVCSLKQGLSERQSDLLVRHGSPLQQLQGLAQQFSIEAIYTNSDYEPAARKRDDKVAAWARSVGIEFLTFKDQCLFEKSEILTGSGRPYTVFTPYKNKVLATLTAAQVASYRHKRYEKNYAPILKKEPLLTMKDLGFVRSPRAFPVKTTSAQVIKNYQQLRDFPALSRGTTHLGMHLRFGTVSVRTLARLGLKYSETWLSELIWRDFFMQILWHFPQVERQSFRPEYDKIAWRKSPADFKKWCEGRTGYPLVDAGMRELNATGYMHNRVRMVAASFLCKHLLIHWREGERYFAQKLLDYDLSSNNGNWQWVAGSGCDAAPYFRIFNPYTQGAKFDPEGKYVQKWVPEYGTDEYPEPMVNHDEARGRCLQAFIKVLKK